MFDNLGIGCTGLLLWQYCFDLTICNCGYIYDINMNRKGEMAIKLETQKVCPFGTLLN